ncbi:hypothetical protein RHS01_09602 [Rhizoctonia solani]|uniref:Retrotransposon gag domain-containing protein n=1 Tax=Rhizoctonia solani TaxID=456999 RepID=A0A8H7I6U7_9AGAM|nr:hypothetical protein RHS01_09602 [Rhizoctonia solani]
MSTQPSTYVHAIPMRCLSPPISRRYLRQAAAHHTDLGTTQATLNNHDSSITNLDALIVKLGADIAKIGTALRLVLYCLGYQGSQTCTPDKFDGISYPGSTVDEQIAFIISCLDGKAHEWLEPYLEEDVVKGNPVSWLHNLDAFWLQFNARWNVQNRTENFRAKLRTLKQTKGVQDYYKDFQTYSQGLGYNDPSLRDMFYDGLSHKIKETLMVQDYDHADASVTLATLAEKALKVDQRLEQFAAQHKGSLLFKPIWKQIQHSTSAAAQGAPRDKLSVGEQVYALWMERLRRGSSKNWPNAKGIAVPIVKWNDGTTMDVTFKTIKKDNHPVTATPLLLPRLPPPPPARNSGPSLWT